MPLTVLTNQKPHFLGLLPAEFDVLVNDWGWPAFRAQQVRDWVYSKLVDAPERMSNLGKMDRAAVSDYDPGF